jgi:hypothetical protein
MLIFIEAIFRLLHSTVEMSDNTGNTIYFALNQLFNLDFSAPHDKKNVVGKVRTLYMRVRFEMSGGDS